MPHLFMYNGAARPQGDRSSPARFRIRQAAAERNGVRSSAGWSAEKPVGGEEQSAIERTAPHSAASVIDAAQPGAGAG